MRRIAGAECTEQSHAAAKHERHERLQLISEVRLKGDHHSHANGDAKQQKQQRSRNLLHTPVMPEVSVQGETKYPLNRSRA